MNSKANIDDIAAVVVLYHPDGWVLENLEPIIDLVPILFVVDNSETAAREICTQLVANTNVAVISGNGNIGIASALNLAAERAIAKGYSFLLTLDQDSRPLPGMIETLAACRAPGVALVAPHLLRGSGGTPPSGRGSHDVLTAMTSGSLLSLDAYRKAGPFRDDFFIDFVDIEYCLRLHRAGYSILAVDNAVLEHHVGTSINLVAGLSVTTHSPVRKYYKMRNRLLVWCEYFNTFPGYISRDCCRFILEMLRLLLFEPDKKEKFDMIRRGWFDFNRGRLGKYAE
jgi:rhamnosyltransferase